MTIVGHVLSLERMRNKCSISLAEPEWKRLLGYLGVYARIILKWIFQPIAWECSLDSSDSFYNLALVTTVVNLWIPPKADSMFNCWQITIRLRIILQQEVCSVVGAIKLSWRLTHILLSWTIWRAPTNASKWRMEFNSAFKGLTSPATIKQ